LNSQVGVGGWSIQAGCGSDSPVVVLVQKSLSFRVPPTALILTSFHTATRITVSFDLSFVRGFKNGSYTMLWPSI